MSFQRIVPKLVTVLEALLHLRLELSAPMP